MGTVGYMAPEQVRGQALDRRADIFAFGAVLLEMLTGRGAFACETPADTMSAILNSDPPDLDTVSGDVSPLARIVRRCLEKKPELRFQSADDLAFALETGGFTEGVAPLLLSEIWTVPAEGGAPRQIEGIGDAFQSSWSPSGTRIAYWSVARGQRDIYTVASGGGAAVPVTQDAALDWAPVWSYVLGTPEQHLKLTGDVVFDQHLAAEREMLRMTSTNPRSLQRNRKNSWIAPSPWPERDGSRRFRPN